MNLYDDYINSNLIEGFSMDADAVIRQGTNAESKWSSYSFNKFNDYVKNKNARLPTIEEVRAIIKNNRIKPNGDIWIPAYNNGRPDWIQVSDSRKGRSHLDYYGQPSWGNSSKSHYWRGKVLVYIPINNYKNIVGFHNESSRTYSSTWRNGKIGSRYVRSTLNSPDSWVMHNNDKKYNSYGRWMIINMGTKKNISGVVIQGRKIVAQYVKAIDVYTSMNIDGPWVTQLSNKKALSGHNQTRNLYFSQPVVCQYVKFVARDWHSYPSLRADVLLYVENNYIEDRKSERKSVIKKSDIIVKVTDTQLNTSKKGEELKKRYSNMGETVKNMKNDAGKYAKELVDYKKKSTNWKADNINKQIRILKEDRDIKRKYFDTLYTLHKDQSRDIVLDNDSIYTRKNILDRRENQIEENTQKLIDIHNDIDTNTRQRRIGEERLYSDKKGFVFNIIMMLVLILVIVIIILKKYGKINSIQIHYILFIVGAIIIGLVFIREYNNKNRNYLNYQDKLF